MFGRTVFFALLLFLAYAEDFGFLPTAAYALASVYFFLKPLRSPFFPAAYWTIVISAPIILSSAQSPFVVSGIIIGFSALYFVLQGARQFPEYRVRAYFFAAGIAGTIAAGKILSSFSQERFFVLEMGVGAWTFLVCIELLLLWRRVYAIPFSAKHIVTIAAVYAVVYMEFFWALSFLPIGFLNAAAIFMLFFFFSLYLHEHALRSLLTRDLMTRAVTVFLIMLVMVLGASRWSI